MPIHSEKRESAELLTGSDQSQSNRHCDGCHGGTARGVFFILACVGDYSSRPCPSKERGRGSVNEPNHFLFWLSLKVNSIIGESDNQHLSL